MGSVKVERFSMIHFTLAQSKLASIQEAGQVGKSGTEWRAFLLRCNRAGPSETSGLLKLDDGKFGSKAGQKGAIG